MEVTNKELIAAYRATARSLVEAMKRAHNVDDLLAAFWASSLPQSGPIGPAIDGTYFFHGYGCRFTVGGKSVEVEFLPGGDHGELGFDAWRLWCFGTKYLGLTDLDIESVRSDLGVAASEGLLVLKDSLYFAA